ncbi:hypothetical protein, partial [Pseudomonas aeruginosa]|uniref:hypothetical protein n=1 Tax=Pseudomonas aeruginosa TaxID=287 RepID=UPI001981DFDB
AASLREKALSASAGHSADRLHFLALGLGHLEEAELVLGHTAGQTTRFRLEANNSIRLVQRFDLTLGGGHRHLSADTFEDHRISH